MSNEREGTFAAWIVVLIGLGTVSVGLWQLELGWVIAGAVIAFAGASIVKPSK